MGARSGPGGWESEKRAVGPHGCGPTARRAEKTTFVLKCESHVSGHHPHDHRSTGTNTQNQKLVLF
jgi:hypothetical protein